MELKGKYLYGIMPLDTEKTECDNRVAFYIKEIEPKILILEAPNQDYSMFDKWQTNIHNYITRGEKYKAIGEKILDVINMIGETDEYGRPKDKEISERWTNERPFTQFIIKTKSKYIAFGHKWNDCHYPNSLWKEGGINDYNKRLIE